MSNKQKIFRIKIPFGSNADDGVVNNTVGKIFVERCDRKTVPV